MYISSTINPIDPVPSLPPITYDNCASNVMNDHILHALEYYLGVVNNFISQSQNLPIQQLEVSHYIDPEESFTQLIITHWLDTSAEVAMKYWEDVNNQVEHGLGSASAEIAETIRDFIVTSVRWKIDDNTE